MKVRVDRVCARDLVIHAVKEILLIPLVVNSVKLRRIEESAGIQTIGCDEVAPLLSSIRQAEAAADRTEATVRREDATRRLCYTEPRSSRYLNHQACFVAVLRWRTSRYRLNRLDRIQRNLV